MYKKIAILVLMHGLLLIYWAYLFHQQAGLNEAVFFNLFSMTIFGTLYTYLYGFLAKRQSLTRTDYFFVVGSFALIGLSLQLTLVYACLVLLTSVALTSYYFLQPLGSGKLVSVSILPLSRKMTQGFTLAFLLVMLILINLLGLEPVIVHIVIHLIFLSFELCLMLFLKEKDQTYEKIYRAYYLSDYLTQDRESFARWIHDDLIQPIYAVKNLLSMKEPDYAYVKQVLTDLEKKARDQMTYYQNHLFDNEDLTENLTQVFHSVQALYPQSKLVFDDQIQPDLNRVLDPASLRLLCILSKELLNNVYKHSTGTYVSYRVALEGADVLLEVESDGASAQDLALIQSSKRGVLLMRLIVDTQSGDLDYQLNGEVLTARVRLKGGHHETIIAG